MAKRMTQNRLKNLTKKFIRRAKSEDGNVMILVGLAMVTLCGFTAMVTDVGALYVFRQQLQASADAGALAGADDYLKGSTIAANTAYNLARQNDAHGDYTATVDTDSATVTVAGSRTADLWLAKVLGQDTSTVHATSTAKIGTLTGGVGMVPIAVPQQVFAYGQEITLSDGAGDGLSGNYGFLDFSGNGANGVEYDIEHGYDFPLVVGEQVSTKPGVMAGPVEKAIDYRMQEDANDPDCSTFDTARPDCPRVMYLPIIDSLDVSGKKDVTILGFAAFYLDGLEGSGGHQEIVGRFIRMIRAGDMGDGADFGTYSVKLTH